MAETHGIIIKEIPYVPITEANIDVTVPFVVGTAPINLSKMSNLPVNVPIYAENLDQAINALGYSDDWESFTLCEVMYSHFRLYGQSPVIFVNVLDPNNHVTAVAPANLTLSKGVATIPADGVLSNTVVLTNSAATTTYVAGTDYNLTVNSAGRYVVSRTASSSIGQTDVLKVNYSKLDASKVTSADIIGGTDVNTGKSTGIELIKRAFPLFRQVPSVLLAPGFSDDPIVAAVMNVKTLTINGNFTSFAITDIPANIPYADVPDWKEDNGYTFKNQLNGYPKVTYDGRTYHASTHIAGAMTTSDANTDGVPAKSPSNKPVIIDGTVLEDGTELTLGNDEAAVLNSAGVMTFINQVGGWKTWGNRTGAFPDATDPQSAFISVRRMFNWIGNTLVSRYFSKIDEPTNKRLIESIVDDANIFMNTLTSAEYILGGRVEWLKADNSDQNLIDGKIVFRVYATPPSPAQEIDFLLAYDPDYIAGITL